MSTDLVVERDVEEAATWIMAKWGHHKAWSSWQSHAAMFTGFTIGSLKEALHTWYKRGTGKAPYPDQLRALVSEIQLLRIQRGVDVIERVCQGEHVFADPWPGDKDRRRYCVLCGEAGPVASCDHPLVRRSDGKCMYCPAKGVQPKEAE